MGIDKEKLAEYAVNLTRIFVPQKGAGHYPKDLLMQVKDRLLNETSRICIRMSILAILQVVVMYVVTTLSGMAASRQGYRIKTTFLMSLLRQDIAWFDEQQDENFAVRVLRSLDCIQNGIGPELILSILYVTNGFAVFCTGFYYSWKMTLIVVSSAPLILAVAYIVNQLQQYFTQKEMHAYSKAGSVAEEALSGIRTVMAYGAEGKELARYEKRLWESYRLVCCRSSWLGLGYGLIRFLSFLSFGVALWYGCRTVVLERCQPDAILTSCVMAVILCMMNSALSISQGAANFERFSNARAAALKIFQIIDRTPVIDSSSIHGLQPKNLEGEIRFSKVSFHYPLRPDIPVLRGLDLCVCQGETVALLGASGCGKSTITQLVQRFYDPTSGEIYLDGVNLRDLNLGWLRSQVGVVGQEPVLFEMSIWENIALGQPGVSFGAVVQASISAGAHDFIMNMPQKYNTLVGEKGAQLSGGQKQRVAIARALVRDPKILLLDEATSALDSVSESEVQSALDLSRKGRTTLVIAHRLSTVKNADRIVVLKDGAVAECGTPQELMSKKELYFGLISSQNNVPIDISDLGVDEMTNSMDIVMEETNRLKKVNGTEWNRPLNDGFTKLMKYNCLRPNVIETHAEIQRGSCHGKCAPGLFRSLQLCFQELHILFLGAVSSVLVGMALPLFTLVYTKSLVILQEPQPEALLHIDYLAVDLIAIGLTAGIGAWIQTFMFGLAGERLTKRIRKAMFKAILSQNASWFDDPKNSSGALCAQLMTDACKVQEAMATLFRSVVQSASTLVTCLYMEVTVSMSLTLLVCSFLPVLVVSTQLNKAFSGGTGGRRQTAEEGCSQTAVEAIRNIRTVASFHLQDTFAYKFIKSLKKPYMDIRKINNFNGVTYGLSRGTMPFACVACMYFGVHLTIDGQITYADIFQTVQALIIGMEVLTLSLAAAPEYHKSWDASDRIVNLLKSKCIGSRKIRPPPIKNGFLHGDIEFRNVHFSYPLRPEVNVLRGLNLKVKAGQTVALVGTSGCGKSTCIALLQRMYDCQQGELLLDGVNIKNMDVSWLRSQMGLVSQEPVLFGVSLSENIAYGAGRKSVCAKDLIDVARTANIHNFICALPQGYETKLGGRESWLSGGEKQRVAIARALVRDPKILLLDEATSALDRESEIIIQDTLDRACKGRTCILIAHRLSTVRNADQIVVLHEGSVVEFGGHQELLDRRGIYYKMHQIQSFQN